MKPRARKPRLTKAERQEIKDLTLDLYNYAALVYTNIIYMLRKKEKLARLTAKFGKPLPGYTRLICGCQADKKDPEWIIPYIYCPNPKHMSKQLRRTVKKSVRVR